MSAKALEKEDTSEKTDKKEGIFEEHNNLILIIKANKHYQSYSTC
jgi:hypothetical protein